MSDKIVESVIDQFRTRAEKGKEKYGTTMERDDLTLMQWLQHLQEELMDAAVYVEKLKGELTLYGKAVTGLNPVLTTKIKVMNIECMLNCLESDWWFDLGVSYQKTPYHHTHKKVMTLSLVFFSVYIRW